VRKKRTVGLLGHDGEMGRYLSLGTFRVKSNILQISIFKASDSRRPSVTCFPDRSIEYPGTSTVELGSSPHVHDRDLPCKTRIASNLSPHDLSTTILRLAERA
jgi:hypothetical protein